MMKVSGTKPAQTKTYSAKPTDVVRKWYVVDAAEASLGRVATRVASLLIGKGKPMVTAHIDTGDYVIVINTKDIKVTGAKASDKIYYRHTGFPGGLRERTFTEQMAIDSTDVLFKAVRGMLPVNKLRDGRLARLKIYVNADHKQDPQQPEIISVHGPVSPDKKEGN